MFGSEGTTENCQFPLVLHVERGHAGDVTLDGLNLILANIWGGKDLIAQLKAGKARAALYVDSRATPEQQTALVEALLTVRRSKYAEIQGPFQVPIEVHLEGDRASVIVPDRLDLVVERLRHQGKYVELRNVPYHITDHVYAGRAVRHRFHDRELGQEWNYDGRNGDFGPFRLKGTIAAKREEWF